MVSTAFRPLDRDELAANPFRVFTSMLVPEDRRFFDADLESRLQRFLAARRLFPDELLVLADRAGSTASCRPRTRSGSWTWRRRRSRCRRIRWTGRGTQELERISGVAADIGGVTTTHINHLTPRVLDIDDLYVSMQDAASR